MMNIKVTSEGFTDLGDVADRVQRRFVEEAGKLIAESIQYVLGNEAELGYDVSPEYALRKAKDPRLRRVVGKSANQPMILTTDIYENIEFRSENGNLVVDLKEGAGISDRGFDYAGYFDTEFQGDGLRFMQKGLDRVKADLPALLNRIISEELLVRG